MRYKPLIERFNEKYKVNTKTGCWDWIGSKVGEYGNIRGELGPDAKIELAHRVSWKLHRGEIPEGKFVLHHCDNMGCVNPEHLFLSDHQGNMTDMANKGRARVLSQKQVKEMLRLSKDHSQVDLAALYKVNRATLARAFKKASGGDFGPKTVTGKGGAYTKLTDEMRLEIVALLKGGSKIMPIAKKYGVDRKTIRNIRSKI